MIGTAWRRIVRFVGSAILATCLLAVVGVWSMLATLIPQGGPSEAAVKAFADSHPLLETIVRAVGLHEAFASPLLLACVVALALSTAVCAWQRTKLAVRKMRGLREASSADAESLHAEHDLQIDCGELSASEALAIAADRLEGLGIRSRVRDGVLTSVSAPWSVWGSPVFHWALLALILVLIGGNLYRSQGLMGVAVGQSKPDAPTSYGILHSGPLRDWGGVNRKIRVDAFDPLYKSGGIDRGPTPTVSLLDGKGAVIKTQRVYPNMTLKSGSLTIYPAAYGLSVNISTVNTAGVETASGSLLVDFSSEATGGTITNDVVGVSDRAGTLYYNVSFTVPLDRSTGGWVELVPSEPSARLLATAPDGTIVADQVMREGEELALPTGGSLRLDSVGYYARLQIVDDGSIPLLYVGLVIAMIGLTVAVLARQQIVLVTAMETPEGVKLVAKVRLWRNASSSRSEIESELTRVLTGDEKEDAA